MGVYEELIERGLIAQVTDEEQIRDLVNNGKAVFYIGFDPTADSLHVGHFMALTLMKRLQAAGNKPIALIGGGTAMIGDPSGRTDMRQMMTKEVIDHNCECFKKQMSKFIDFGEGKAMMVNNADWLLDLNYVEVLREVGACFSVNRMLSAECYKQRMEKGLSFLEFNYMIMQSYDFYALYQKYGCNLQFGGDDQWSNMIGGMELIRRKLSGDANAMTITLLLNSEGKKMGKTQSGALWLSPEKTSPYEFYQFWFNQTDADAEKYIKMFTLLSVDEIESLIAEHKETPHLRKLQKVLAFEVTKMVHSEEDANKAIEMSNALFDKNTTIDTFKNMDEKTLLSVFNGVPQFIVKKGFVETNPTFIDFAVESKFGQSKGSVRKEIMNGGLSLNKVKVGSIDVHVGIDDLIHDKYLILQRGKKYALVTVD